MNNPTERPPYPDQEMPPTLEPLDVESPTPEAIEMRIEEDKDRIEVLRTELAPPSIETRENDAVEETIEKPIETSLSSSSKMPRLLRKVALLAGMLGLSFGSASATEGSTKDDDKGNKIEKTTETKKVVTDQLREDWNDYVDWLEEKGLKGAATLDEGDLGLKMIEEYRAEHPETTVSNETVGQIQEEFAKYRTWALDQIKQGKAAFAPGVTEETFMKNLSDSDGYAGQLTTKKKFPAAYIQKTIGGATRTVKYAEFSKTDTFAKNK
ncbi:MAG TPA: hypothetical protein VGE18_03140 [Candidatus Paceibacterota bacterium]